MTISVQPRNAAGSAPIRQFESLPGQLNFFNDEPEVATVLENGAGRDATLKMPQRADLQDFDQTVKRARIAKATSRPIKRHGGKSYLADWIIPLMPPRVRNPNKPASNDSGWLHYVEPYFGSGAVLFSLDPEGISEVVNDLDLELTNFWHVLQSPELFLALDQRLRNTPCSQIEFERACNEYGQGDPVERAAKFFVRNRQSRQALGSCFATTTRSRTRRGMNDLPSAWQSAIDGLAEFHERLQRVVILREEACEVIHKQDGIRTLSFLDPPYLHETRSTNSEYGQYEMAEPDHRRLLETLAGIKGRFLLSGYHSRLYDEFAAELGWACHEREVDLKSSSKKKKERRTECVWTNY